MLTRRRITGGPPRCPYCHGQLRRDAHAPSLVSIECAWCGTPHHVGCFLEHGSCTALGCGSEHARWGGSVLCTDELRAAVAVEAAPPTGRIAFAITTVLVLVAHLFVIACLPLIVESPCFIHDDCDCGRLFFYRSVPGPRIDADDVQRPGAHAAIDFEESDASEADQISRTRNDFFRFFLSTGSATL